MGDEVSTLDWPSSQGVGQHPGTTHALLWMAPLATFLLIAVFGAALWSVGRMKLWFARKLTSSEEAVRNFYARRRHQMRALETASNVLVKVSYVVLAFFLASAILSLPVVIANAIGKSLAARLVAEIDTASVPRICVGTESRPALVGDLMECTERYCVLYANKVFLTVPEARDLATGSTAEIC